MLIQSSKHLNSLSLKLTFDYLLSIILSFYYLMFTNPTHYFFIYNFMTTNVLYTIPISLYIQKLHLIKSNPKLNNHYSFNNIPYILLSIYKHETDKKLNHSVKNLFDWSKKFKSS
jgi:hypothetical protein